MAAYTPLRSSAWLFLCGPGSAGRAVGLERKWARGSVLRASVWRRRRRGLNKPFICLHHISEQFELSVQGCLNNSIFAFGPSKVVGLRMSKPVHGL